MLVRWGLALVAVLGVLALVAARSPARPPAAADPFAAQLGRTADRGLALALRRYGWHGWLVSRPGFRDWAPLWQTVHVTMAAEGVAAATGRPAALARVHRLLVGAEGYWQPAIGGYAGSYRDPERTASWFDDNGWLGLAFFEGYRQTGDRRFLHDARRALAYILRAGWDRHGGGIWWSGARDFKSGESAATAALLAVRLHAATGDPALLAAARRIVDWTNRHLLDRASGLYLNRPGGGPISYLQSPMLSALGRLCRDEGLYCGRLQPLVEATVRTFGPPLSHAPQYDAMYLRFLVDAYEVLPDPRFVTIVRTNALRAEGHAADGRGLFVRDWSGGNREAPPGGLQTHAATVEALAWAAAIEPARSR